MGTYMYEETSNQFNIQTLHWGVMICNEIKYWTKPYWDLYNESYLYHLSEQDKRIITGYRRKRAAAAKRKPHLHVARKDADGSLIVYKWVAIEVASVLFADDETFGNTLKRIGVARKVGGKWRLVEEV